MKFSRSQFFAAFILVWLLAMSATVFADTIAGTVKDPSGAVIAGARVEISGGSLKEPLVMQTDGAGNFAFPDVTAGTYTLKVERTGFESVVKEVQLQGRAKLELAMEIAKHQTTLAVSGKASSYANSDPAYRELRSIGLGESFRVDGLSFASDVGTFQFTNGTLTLLKPINGMVTGAIFLGEGHFHLKPVLPIDAKEMQRRAHAEEFDEDYTIVVFRFGSGGMEKFKAGLTQHVETPGEADKTLEHWRDRMRQRREFPLGLSEALLQGEQMDNVDADVLAAVYNPKHPEFFNAYIHGKKYKDLRFYVRERVGAIPQLDSAEEVALINSSSDNLDDGIYYLAHLSKEYKAATASSWEDRRLFETHGYKIETAIAKNGHLFSSAALSYASLVEGERVMKFGLLPNLRVSRVFDETGHELFYIQESRKDDGSFYVILPEAPVVGQEHKVQIEYAGDKVLEAAGGGSFYVQARTSWYPNLNGFGEKATYDLTFKVPKKYKVISVGRLANESVEDDLAVTHWITPAPVAVAGFNYGEYKRVDLTDEATGTKISGFYLEDLPGELRQYSALKTLAPHAMTTYAVNQTRAQLQLCNHYFGKNSFDEIYITEQPNFNFGQSWPNLVYLPISAYTDSTQRWMLFGDINLKFSGFVQEVTPHEVAHQWWGHAVGWASYHDQWLSEGFAEFSAGLFLQQATGEGWRKDYLEFWDRLRERILRKNAYGNVPNDAGPLWLGLRLMSPRSPEAYQNITYPKGAYVLQMLRSMMFSNQDGDKQFIEMMHEFVEAHRQKPASTESFKYIAEKHMTKTMDLAHNGRLDWFFNEWVYGTEIPRYEFEYQTSSAENGKVKLHMTIAQSDVGENFGMLVPVYADFGKGLSRIGQVAVVGTVPRSVDVVLPAQPKKVALNSYKDVLER